MMTGVIAVAHRVPACHSRDTTSAATTEATAAANSVLRLIPVRLGGAGGGMCCVLD
jgi:hypothetical protein